ncbi:MAG TPA: sugar phosphate isomerase/epimerase [Candidatus Eisenbergiella stercorigallinarum]|uniref:Sugar phosphate isomerase/epimerase n=1 Tax=Candidatus Eisenbergiella stercorigallinarum TaxID=2838557 RepID=A0A9D2TZP3_9FIRM|nr:sugar phosphate isomerase/epimerase [Candidatus Eisenbergiella stercorigallinarum]
MKTGAQLYTVRAYTQTERDFSRTVKKIAEMGYTTVQISAIGKEIRPERVREICEENGLKIVLTHSDVNRILNDTDRLIREHEILGCDHIGLGAMPEKYRTPEWIRYFAEDFKEPAKKIAAAGKRFMYHNHNFEFQKIAVPGYGKPVRIIEYLMDSFTPEEMGFTLDTYWVAAAGADVCGWIARLSGRIPCVHLKDMAVSGFEQLMAPVMEGNLNFPAILSQLEKTDCEYLLVEQDICQGSPFDCLKTSYDNLAAAGYR